MISPVIYLSAVLLLAAAPGTAPPEISAEDWPTLRSALHEVAVEWEILDPRELRYVLSRREDFTSDIELLRRRYSELRDAPKLAECERLLERTVVNEMLAFNRSYRRHLEQLLQTRFDRARIIQQAIKETDQLYAIWDCVRDARCEYYYVTVRRTALKRLQELLGAAGWQDGSLPPHVPLWRFEDFD